MPRKAIRPRIVGLDPVWVLAVRPEKKGASPVLFLMDQVKWPGIAIDTSVPTRARAWGDSSGPRHLFAAHPHLKKRYYSFRLDGLRPDPKPAPRRKPQAPKPGKLRRGYVASNAVADRAQRAIDARIAAQYDPAATPFLFGVS